MKTPKRKSTAASDKRILVYTEEGTGIPNGKTFVVGTKQGTAFLARVNVCVIEGDEPILFSMKKQKDAVWIGEWGRKDKSLSFPLGQSHEITYAKIKKAWKYFINEQLLKSK